MDPTGPQFFWSLKYEGRDAIVLREKKAQKLLQKKHKLPCRSSTIALKETIRRRKENPIESKNSLY